MPFRLLNRLGLCAEGEVLLCFERCIRLQICMPALVISGRWRQAENGQKQTFRFMSVVSAGEAVVPTSELSEAFLQIRELQQMLDKKKMEAKILKRAVEIIRSRKWIVHSPLLRGNDQ